MKDSISVFLWRWLKAYPAIVISTVLGLTTIIFLWSEKSLDLRAYLKAHSSPWSDLSINELFFIFGSLCIFIPLLILLFYRLWVNIRIIYYRLKYPYINLNKAFYLIHFSGKVFLLDIQKNPKEIRWIKTWQTYIDLDFISEFVDLEKIGLRDFWGNNKFEFSVADGKKFKVGEFVKGKPIYTQDTAEEFNRF